MKFRLVEDSPDKVYHYTSVEKFISILNDNKFIPGPWKNLSTTISTTPAYYTHNITNVLLTLNYQKLMDNFEGSSYDSTSGNDGVDAEHEIRFKVHSPIENFTSYIESVKIHKELGTTEIGQMYLNRININSFEELISFIKSKISNIIVEDLHNENK
jgi:hypothetical protein